MASADEGCHWYGQVVWFWRRDPGVKLAGIILQATVAKKAAHREEHEVRRKAIAWGMSECSPLNLYASVPFLCARAHETAGAARTPAPPRPLFRERGQFRCTTRAKTCRGNVFCRPGQASNASADPGPIRRGGNCLRKVVD